MRPPIIYSPSAIVGRHRGWDRRVIIFGARCPHGLVGEWWTAQPSVGHERIVTTVDCPCPEEAA